jgi:shikimate kinase/3-dehydroquinate synthase
MFHDDKFRNIALIGFSATGKSTIAKYVAEYLGWAFIDTDSEIVKDIGKTIPEIFEQDGEDRFRQIEHKVLKESCLNNRTVISTGGGTVLNPENIKILQENSFMICLEAKVETIYRRLVHDNLCSESPEVRPLLAGENPLERIKQLKAFRQPYYSIADWTVNTDSLTLEEVSQEVIKGWKYLTRSSGNYRKEEKTTDITCMVETASRHYPVFAGWDLLDKLGEKMKQVGLAGKAIIISDETVFSIYGEQAKKAIERVGFPVIYYIVPPGEPSKNISQAIKIYDFLVSNHIERNDVIVSLGGGVVGDLAGFVAATYLRGIFWIQVPTTLIGMVDASIGGKVAVDHQLGKNLVGSFYQPYLVLADVKTLTSLPLRELTSGWAEVIKYGLVFDAKLFTLIEDNVGKLQKLTRDITTEIITQSVVAKAQIVSRDERETGERIILNYGHTVAHALEVAGNYKDFLHGEAVAIGMTVAAKISQQLGLLSRSAVQRQQSILEQFSLPVTCSAEGLDNILAAMELDKKVRNKSIQWVLLEEIGKPIVRSNISQDITLNALNEVIKM